MSSFRVGGTQVSFTAVNSLNDEGGPLEEISVGILVDTATDWGALFSLRSWNVTVRPIPGGTNVYVDIGGGAGVGTLVLDGFDSHSAILTKVNRDYVEDGVVRSLGSATFLITG